MEREPEKTRLRADLHTHTRSSDGELTPSELVSMAEERGLDVLAVTDHDTIDGLPEALEAGTRLNIRVLPGIEFSAREYPYLHILGYGFRLHDTGLQALCQELRLGRDSRKTRIVDYLNSKGVPVTLQQVEKLAGGGMVSRSHFARVLMDMGVVESVSEAFAVYLDTPEFRKTVEREKPSAREILETLKSAGGKTSLAHPNQLRLSEDALDALVGDLRGYGLDAVECFYPTFTGAETAQYKHLASKYGLHETGGSDFHGQHIRPGVTIARWELELGWLLR